MNNDYLWDKTGEPDPEIQELEELLGTLAFQPRPLVAPDHLHAGQRRFISPAAIAAAVALLLLGAAVWWGLNRPPKPSGVELVGQPSINNVTPAAPAKEHTAIADEKSRQVQPEPKLHEGLAHVAHVRNNNRIRARAFATDLTATQRAEAAKAKEDLLLALRLASAKLTLAQKRTLGTPVTNLNRNQHTIG
jgi:hypothetical protein